MARRTSNPPAKAPNGAPRSRFKFDRVRDVILEQIRTGALPSGARLPAEKVIAKQLRAGRKTVERALHELVREGLVVRRRGSGSYVADRRHPPLIPGRTLRLGLLWKLSFTPPDLHETFFGQIARGALSVFGLDRAAPAWDIADPGKPVRAQWDAPERGLRVEALAESSASQVRHPPLEDVRAGGFDGLLTIGIIEPGWLQELLALGVPAVLVDVLDDRFARLADQVYVDPGPGYREAVQHLAGRGCKRIHFVGGFTSIPAPSDGMNHQEVAAFRQGRMQVDPDSYLRLSAYRQALDACGLPAREDWAHFENPFFLKDADLAKRLAGLSETERPDAVICHSILQADTITRAFAARGLRCLAAGTVSDAYAGPALAIRVDGRELGATAAELMISRLQRPGRLACRVGVPMVFEPPLKA